MERHLLAERTQAVAELLLARLPVLLAAHTLVEGRLLVLAELRSLVPALPVLPVQLALPLVRLALEAQGLGPEQHSQLEQAVPESHQTGRERSECRQHTPNR